MDAIITSPPFWKLRKYGDGAEMGNEASPAEFIGALLDLTAEFRRVLAPHGSLALELGDTYVKKSLRLTPFAYPMALAYGHHPFTGQPSPAGQWLVRNVIAWCRPNPSVGAPGDKVRPGTSYITVACTSPRRWFDLDAVRGPHKTGADAMRPRRGVKEITNPDRRTKDEGTGSNPAGTPPLDWWEDGYDADDLGHIALIQSTQGGYKGAHYAVWPRTLARRLILALCPPGGTVLDPFAGSGTTLAVATECGRQAIGIELYEANADLIRERCGPVSLVA